MVLSAMQPSLSREHSANKRDNRDYRNVFLEMTFDSLTRTFGSVPLFRVSIIRTNGRSDIWFFHDPTLVSFIMGPSKNRSRSPQLLMIPARKNFIIGAC